MRPLTNMYRKCASYSLYKICTPQNWLPFIILNVYCIHLIRYITWPWQVLRTKMTNCPLNVWFLPIMVSIFLIEPCEQNTNITNDQSIDSTNGFSIDRPRWSVPMLVPSKNLKRPLRLNLNAILNPKLQRNDIDGGSRINPWTCPLRPLGSIWLGMISIHPSHVWLSGAPAMINLWA